MERVIYEDEHGVKITAGPREAGGASTVYLISHSSKSLCLTAPLDEAAHGAAPAAGDVVLNFQTGPIPVVGVNGLTIEMLIAIAIDRLRGFQEGPVKCRQNALALTQFEQGLHWLNDRTSERKARGVEGEVKP